MLLGLWILLGKTEFYGIGDQNLRLMDGDQVKGSNFWRRCGFRAGELGVDLGWNFDGAPCVASRRLHVILESCCRSWGANASMIVAHETRLLNLSQVHSASLVLCLWFHVIPLSSIAFRRMPLASIPLRSLQARLGRVPSGSTAVRSATLCYVPLCSVPCSLFYSVVAFRSGFSAWPLSCLCDSRDRHPKLRLSGGSKTYGHQFVMARTILPVIVLMFRATIMIMHHGSHLQPYL